MAAASAEPHPSSRAALLPYLPVLNFFLGINTPAARGGRLRRARSRPRSPPTPRPGPVRALASELRFPSQPSPRGRVRAASTVALARLFLPASQSRDFRPSPDLPPGFGSGRGHGPAPGSRPAGRLEEEADGPGRVAPRFGPA